MSFKEHKNEIVYEKISVVKSIHNSKESMKKKYKIKDKDLLNRLFKRVFGLIFMLNETNFLFMLNGTNFVFMLFALMLFGTQFFTEPLRL